MSFDPQLVLDFWFPDDGHWLTLDSHAAFWTHRMQGGTDAEICARFEDLTIAAARGALAHWADSSRGRLALIIALDQFPRSLWRGTPGAYAQDIRANLVALEGISNGHHDALEHGWERKFYHIALGHCEGPDHLDRLALAERLSDALDATTPPHLARFQEIGHEQNAAVRAVIERFGRHPHRNAILGRISTPEEEAYIEAGRFPHERQLDDEAGK